MAEESLLHSHTEDLSNASPTKSSSLLSDISNASTRPFVLAFIACSSGAFSYGCIVGYTAPTQASIMKDLNLSIADFSFFGSILTVGVILGALVCGKLTDLVGRFYTIWITNTLFLLGWFAIACAKGPIYISEVAPKNLRGTASSLVQLFIGVGISVFYVLGTLVDWRNLAILGSIPSLVVLPLLFFVPESPRWLAKVGRGKEVEVVLLSLRGARSDVSDEATHILEYAQHVEEQQDIEGHGFFKLFQRKYSLPLTIGVVLISMPQLGGLNGYTFYTDTIFTSIGVSSNVGFILTSIVQVVLL